MNETMTEKRDLKQILPDRLVDELLAGCETPEEITGKDGLLAQLTKRLVERALGAEMEHHLASERAEEDRANHRNGYSEKTLIGEHGKVPIDVPRDREGSFEPMLVRKRQKRLGSFDNKIIAMYARGMTVREIRAFLHDHYGVEVSPDLISQVTSAVIEEVREWQNRPLESVYAVVFFDALRVKVRDEGLVRNKAVYLALGITMQGTKEMLGIWIEQNEGAKFWLRVNTELRNRGVEDILIAVVDGLKGFPEAINAVYPQTIVQTCIVHLLRNSLAFCNWKDRKQVTHELKGIYQAENAEVARERLEAFAQSPWGRKYPTIAPSWRSAWEQVIPFLSFPAEIRRVIYTTNAIESVHMQVRKVTKNRGHFPNDEAAVKLIYLALRNITCQWKAAPIHWKNVMTQFTILFADRLEGSAS